MRRSELEKLPTVSVKSKLYVEIDALLEALKAKEAEAQTEARALPRPAAEKTEKP